MPRTDRQLRNLLLVLVLAPLLCDAPPVFADDPFLVVYDVSDLVRPLTDFPAPRLGLEGLEPVPAQAAGGDALRPRWTTDDLVELIKKVVMPESWEKEDAQIIAADGKIIVFHSAEAQQQAAKALDSVESIYTVEVHWLSATEAACARLGFDAKGARLQRAARTKVLKAMAELAGCAERADRVTTPAPRDPSLAVTLFAGQSGRIVLGGGGPGPAHSEEHAYVSRLEKNADGVVDPVIDTYRPGQSFEAKVVPTASGKQIQLSWALDSAAEAEPPEETVVDGAGSVQSPLVEQERFVGTTTMRLDECLIVRCERAKAGAAPCATPEAALMVISCVRATPAARAAGK